MIMIGFYILAIASFAHLFLALYNRYFLILTDGPWKIPLIIIWWFASFLIPTAALLTASPDWVYNNLIAWPPETLLGELFYLPIMGLIAFLLHRSIIWTVNRFFPEGTRNLLDETISKPIMPEVPSRLPRGFRRFETTGDLVVTHREIAVNGLAPAFDGLRVVQVSDVHFGQYLQMENFLRGLHKLVAQLDGDIVLLTGDFINKRRDIPKSVEYHAGFRGRLATFCVLGNHDYWTDPDRVLEELSRTHIRWLGGGERRSLKKMGRRLVFTGTDAPWDHQRPDWRRSLRRGVGDAVVLLSHTPDNAPAAAKNGASLIVSGHNHGGEICIPPFGPVVVPSRYGVRYAGGVYRVGVDSVLHVSRGVGASSGGIRIFCQPEINVITLKAPIVEVMAGKIIPARSILKPLEPEDVQDFLPG